MVGAHPFNHGRGGDSKKSEMLLLSESGKENFSERGGGFGEMEASLKIPGSRMLLAGEEAFFARLMRKKCFRHSETSLDKEAKCIHK